MMENFDKTSLDYDRMARAIEYLDSHAGDQPSLDDLAGEMGLSPNRAQRVFRRWAGLTPKQFVSLVTMNQARPLLEEGESVLNVAYDVGLSGPGRLHDLCIRCEAMSPGEIKSGGAGLVISYGWCDTPFGRTLILYTSRGVTGLAFADPKSDKETLADMMSRWPKAEYRQDAQETEKLAEKIFSADGGDLSLLVGGTPFQIAVWRALLEIPAGATSTYQSIAEEIGKPKAIRAVGTAVGRNPISYLIPCHRVLRVSGALGGYHWGLTRKKAMLAYERANAEFGADTN